MNTKRLFSTLAGTGMRIMILASMLITSLIGVIPAAAAAVTIDLYAVTGTTTFPGMPSPVTVWGYSLDGSPVTKPGGPVITINQGDTVTITLHNAIGEQTALLIQGQSMAPDLVGIADGASKEYTFTASKPGTFLYEAGLLPNAQHQLSMGLYGALIVRPAVAGQAYDSASSAFDAEAIMVLSEFNTSMVSNPAAFDMRNFKPDYLLINGQSYPSTPGFPVASGNKVALRYLNAGVQAHSMTALGLNQTLIAQDGHPYTYSRNVVAETIASGETLDAIVTIPSGATSGAQFVIYDANMLLHNNTGGGAFAGLGGMLTTLNVGTPTGLGDITGPIASGLALVNNGDGTFTVNATINDVTTGNNNIAAAEFYIDSTSGTATSMTGAFAAPTETVSGDILVVLISTLAPGDHTVYVRGQDFAGNWGAFASITLNIAAAPPVSDALHFSTAGVTASGPSGVGADFGDIYSWDGTAFSVASNVLHGFNVDGFSPVSDTEFYVSFADDVNLPDVGDVQNEDVVYFDGANWSVFFDGTGLVDLADTNGVDTNIDAISVAGGILYFSTGDDSSVVGGFGDDADIFSWDGANIALVFDATAMGWSGNNVDGITFVDADHFYLSYSSTSTPVSGVGIVQDEDVVYYDMGVWSVYFDGTSKGLISFNLDVDAFSVP